MIGSVIVIPMLQVHVKSLPLIIVNLNYKAMPDDKEQPKDPRKPEGSRVASPGGKKPKKVKKPKK